MLLSSIAHNYDQVIRQCVFIGHACNDVMMELMFLQLLCGLIADYGNTIGNVSSSCRV